MLETNISLNPDARFIMEVLGTQVHYIPVSSQPYYQALYGRQKLTGAESYYARTLSLPLFPAMLNSDVEHVVTNLKEVINVNNR